MKPIQRIRPRRNRPHATRTTDAPDTGGDTLRALWHEYVGDPYRQALDLAADQRRGRP